MEVRGGPRISRSRHAGERLARFSDRRNPHLHGAGRRGCPRRSRGWRLSGPSLIRRFGRSVRSDLDSLGSAGSMRRSPVDGKNRNAAQQVSVVPDVKVASTVKRNLEQVYDADDPPPRCSRSTGLWREPCVPDWL